MDQNHLLSVDTDITNDELISQADVDGDGHLNAQEHIQCIARGGLILRARMAKASKAHADANIAASAAFDDLIQKIHPGPTSVDTGAATKI